jgi:hypothetical protein
MNPGSIEIRILSSAFDEALRLLPRFTGERELPKDFGKLARKILLLLLEPNESHEHGEAISGYDEEGHRVFIAYYCALGSLPDTRLATLAFLHEFGHIFLEMDEGEAEELTLRAAGEMGLDGNLSGEERRGIYSEKRHVWNEGRFPYLAVLRDEIGPEEAKRKIDELSERGFDFSV